MKEKILKAIDKGLMNVLSPDIKDQDIDFDHDNINSEYVRYEYNTVDMGKAGIWCEYNLGAYPGNKASDWYGDYYAWGETETKDDYSWKTYKHCKGTCVTITKYNENDGLKRLESKDDIVTQTLSEIFKMPTIEEYEKLIENTTNEWVENYKDIKGLNGRLFTAKNGNTLFFPITGRYIDFGRYTAYDAADYGYLWAASLYSDDYDYDYAFSFYVNSDEVNTYHFTRDIGLPVRGIQNSY